MILLTYGYCQVDDPKTTVEALRVFAVAVSFAVVAVASHPEDRNEFAVVVVAVEASLAVFAVAYFVAVA